MLDEYIEAMLRPYGLMVGICSVVRISEKDRSLKVKYVVRTGKG